MRPKYKIVRLKRPRGYCWAIQKRICGLFYIFLTFSKIVRIGKLCSYSKEILTFRTKNRAKREVEMLKSGVPPIISRIYRNGRLQTSTRKGRS